MTRALVFSLAAAALALAGCPGSEEAEPCVPGPGVICTYIGTGISGLGPEGMLLLETDLYLPQDLTLGPDDRLYIVDWNNHRIRAADATAVHTVVGTGYLGDAQDGPANAINLNHPTNLAFEPDGNMIIAAWHNSKVLRYNTSTNTVATICGTGMRSFNGDGMPALMTHLDLPAAVAIAPDGSILIADQANQRIRSLNAAGLVTTIAGDGMQGYAGDGGPALMAQLRLPVSQSAPPAGRITVDSMGVIYLADTLNHAVRRVGTDGVISTIAGTGMPGSGPDQLNTPADVAVDAAGNVFVADTQNHCVRRIAADGTMTTAVGQCGSPGYAGDGGPASAALLDRPYGVEVGTDGTLYVADTHNHVVRIVYP